MARPKSTDAPKNWPAIEYEYRLNLKSLRQIASEYDTTHATIDAHAKKHGWERDMAARIRQQAAKNVTKAELELAKQKRDNTKIFKSELTKQAYREKIAKPEAKATEAKIIEVNATAQALAIMEERSDVKRLRKLANKLTIELESQTNDTEVYIELAEIVAAQNPAEIGKLRDVFAKTLTLPSRIDSMKKLSETAKTLIYMERDVFGIAPSIGDTDDPLTAFMRSVTFRSKPIVHDDPAYEHQP